MAANTPEKKDLLMDKVIELKKALNEKFDGHVRSSVNLPCPGQTQSVTFSTTIAGKDVHLGTLYLKDRNDFLKGDIVKKDDTVAFNLIHEKDIPTKVNIRCFTPNEGLQYLSNFRVGYNAAKAEAETASNAAKAQAILEIEKVQSESNALKQEIEKLKNSLSQIHMLSEPSQDA